MAVACAASGEAGIDLHAEGLLSPSARSGRAAYTQPFAPRDWEDEVIYVIDIKNFFNGDPTNDVMVQRYGPDMGGYNDGYRGGDLAGIIQKLDYLSDLGVTALMLYPIVQNDQYPFGDWLAGGYRPKDYFTVDENLGTTDTLLALMDQAHERGIRIFLDLPLSLPGVEHPLYTEENVEKGYFGDWTIYGVRQWNADNPFVADYLIEISTYWRDLTGCDGFRLDSAHLQSNDYWRRYAGEVGGRPTSDSLFLMAEVPLPTAQVGDFIRQTHFTSAYDFSTLVTQEVFGRGGNVSRLSFVATEAHQYYPEPRRMCGEIDNYSNAFVTVANEPVRERARLALAFLLTLDRIPLLYAGDEYGVWTDEVGGLFDPANQDPEFFQWVKDLIALRKREATLRRGAFQEVYSQNPLYAFLRIYETDRILVVTNKSQRTQLAGFPIPGGSWNDLEMVDLLTGQVVKPRGSPDPITLPELGIAILRLRTEAGSAESWVLR